VEGANIALKTGVVIGGSTRPSAPSDSLRRTGSHPHVCCGSPQGRSKEIDVALTVTVVRRLQMKKHVADAMRP